MGTSGVWSRHFRPPGAWRPSGQAPQPVPGFPGCSPLPCTVRAGSRWGRVNLPACPCSCCSSPRPGQVAAPARTRKRAGIRGDAGGGAVGPTRASGGRSHGHLKPRVTCRDSGGKLLAERRYRPARPGRPMPPPPVPLTGPEMLCEAVTQSHRAMTSSSRHDSIGRPPAFGSTSRPGSGATGGSTAPRQPQSIQA